MQAHKENSFLNHVFKGLAFPNALRGAMEGVFRLNQGFAGRR
jgi:hypothetical protein